MINFSSLPTLVKTDVSGSHYLLVEDKSSSFESKISIETLFANLVTLGTSSEQLYASITNKNQLNFKGIKSGDASLLTVTTGENNIVLTALEAGIDLNECNNTNSGFLKSIDFAETIAGVNAVVNGGTGLAAIAKGAMLYASGTNTIAATAAMSTNGQILIGNATTGIPTLNTITGGAGVTVDNSTPGAITLTATIANAEANIDLRNLAGSTTYNIDTNNGEGWLSGDGTAEGITVDDTGKVFIGQATPPAVFDETLNIKGGIRFTNDSAPTIKPSETISSNAGQSLTIEGGSSSSGVAGNLNLLAGTASGSAAGGNVILTAGRDTSGTSDGNIQLKTYTGASAVTGLLLTSESQNVIVGVGNLMIASATKGIVHTGSGTVSQITSHSTAVDAIDSTSGVITLHSVALAAGAEADFAVPNSTIKTDSVILLTVQSPAAASATNNATMVAELDEVNSGSMNIRLSNPGAGATTGVYKIHFLVINKS
jgi:hypothetical protein